MNTVYGLSRKIFIQCGHGDEPRARSVVKNDYKDLISGQPRDATEGMRKWNKRLALPSGKLKVSRFAPPPARRAVEWRLRRSLPVKAEGELFIGSAPPSGREKLIHPGTR